VINKQSPPTLKQPTLEQRIVSILAHANAGSEAIMELVAEVEDAVTLADLNIEAERAKAIDLVQNPDPREAHERVVVAELIRDRLHAAIPRLRDRLSAALRKEAHERWLSDFSRVRQALSDAASLFRDYRQHAEAIVRMFALAEQVDKEVSRINGTAPGGEHRRLRFVELEARDLEHFSRDNPSLASTVELRDWDNSGKTLWPRSSSGSFAAMAVSGMTVLHPGVDWSTAEVREQRRKESEREQRCIAEHYATMTQEQEDRLNCEERGRAQTPRRV
jgi:hypothetical protein